LNIQVGESMDLELEGKNILITGGSAGLGLALAELLVGEGARVCIFARGAERMREANRRLHELGGEETLGLLGDVTDPEHIQGLVFTLEDNWDRIDAVVNNAGGLAAGWRSPRRSRGSSRPSRSVSTRS
jgi:3-oxoacyl-[acyl-carrier protein] reductase